MGNQINNLNAPSVGGGKPPRQRSMWARFELGPLLSFATLLLLAGTAVMMVEGFSRSFFNTSHFWAEELVRYFMIWSFFLTLGAAGSAGNHIRSNLLMQYLPAGTHRVMNFLASLIGAAFSATMLWSSWPQVHRYYTMGMMTESNLDLPMWVLFLAMPLGGALWLIYYLRCMYSAARGMDPFASEDELPNPEL